MDTGNWRTQLQADSRQRIVNKMMETLRRHIPFYGNEGLQELRKIAVRFEEKTYTAATSQSDYLRKISLKMLSQNPKSDAPSDPVVRSMMPKEVSKKIKSQCLNSDRISALPESIIEKILTLMPIRDALRTSMLSKKWRYSWRTMPTLVFTDDMIKVPSHRDHAQLKRYKLASAIFHVLLLHNGPTILEFNFSCCVSDLLMDAEFDQIISYISKGNNVKVLTLTFGYHLYKLPVSFFSLHGLERISLENCIFEPPLTIKRFSWLKTMVFVDVKVSAQMLQRFLSKCPVLEDVCLIGHEEAGIDFAEGGHEFTFVDLFQCVPLINRFGVSKYYMKHLSAGGMPHKLPTSLVHLEVLYLDVCLMEQDEISSALCIIRSSPELEKIIILMCDNEKLPVQQTPTNFLDPECYSDLNLDYLETLEIKKFSNLPLETKFVKLIMAKSPALQMVRIELSDNFSADEELKMLRDLVRLPFPRASPSANLIIERPKTS